MSGKEGNEMKRRFCLLLAALLLLTACLSLPVLADEEEHGVMDNVTDVADVLTYDEWSELNARTERMTEEYGCHIVILTWDEIGEGLTADELLDHVWGIDNDSVETRVTDETVRRIRRKLSAAGSCVRITAVWGYGYKLEASDR